MKDLLNGIRTYFASITLKKIMESRKSLSESVTFGRIWLILCKIHILRYANAVNHPVRCLIQNFFDQSSQSYVTSLTLVHRSFICLLVVQALEFFERPPKMSSIFFILSLLVVTSEGQNYYEWLRRQQPVGPVTLIQPTRPFHRPDYPLSPIPTTTYANRMLNWDMYYGRPMQVTLL